MSSIAPQAGFGSFVPTTQIWDPAVIEQMDVTSPEFKRVIVQLYQNMNLFAQVINTKESGYYVEEEFVNGNVWFPNPIYNSTTAKAPILRPEFTTAVNFGALPNTATKTVAHGLTITAGYRFTHIYGAATNPSTAFIPLPYASPTLANNIEVSVDATNVIVTTGSDRTAFTDSFIVLRYIKE